MHLALKSRNDARRITIHETYISFSFHLIISMCIDSGCQVRLRQTNEISYSAHFKSGVYKSYIFTDI